MCVMESMYEFQGFFVCVHQRKLFKIDICMGFSRSSSVWPFEAERSWEEPGSSYLAQITDGNAEALGSLHGDPRAS